MVAGDRVEKWLPGYEVEEEFANSIEDGDMEEKWLPGYEVEEEFANSMEDGDRVE